MPAILKLEAGAARSFFFHGPKVQNRLDNTKTRGLKKCGALVRRIARNSLRYSQNASKPGQPPKVHGSGSLLKEFIYFIFDKPNWTCLVGPARTNQSRDLPVGNTVPGVLEHGGLITFNRREYIDSNSSGGRVRRRIFQSVTRKLEPRPFMVPALEKAQDRYPHLFAEAWGEGGSAR